MVDANLITLGTAALGGGVVVKLLEFAFQEFKEWRVGRTDHSTNIDKSFEPLLRAADELVGKLRSLGEQDFLPIREADLSEIGQPNVGSVIYLFVQFWSEIENLRFRGWSTKIARSPRGRKAQAFLRCLESRRLRLIDRISQRAVGEAAQLDRRTMNYVEFMKSLDSDPYVRRWLEPLIIALGALGSTEGRQRVLQYAVVVHALIDTLDKDRLVTRDRPALPNKLNKRSKRDLTYRVFGVYLKFVVNRTKYIGPLS
jgi:hypothetical protein